MIYLFSFLMLIAACSGAPERHPPVAFRANPSIQRDGHTIETRFNLPAGYERIPFPDGSFPFYLRKLPLKPPGSEVLLYDGRVKQRKVHEAVIDRDPGHRNLQQCADAVIRLRAEYLYDIKQYNAIHFNLTNGFRVDYGTWIQGYRVAVDGNKTQWIRSGQAGNTETVFRQYLDFIYTYAGTLSLEKEMIKISADSLQPGDVFIRGGSPGHAVIIVDAGINRETGEKIFMLAQSYMPAQEIHILKNTGEPSMSPWYRAREAASKLETPEWTFCSSDLRRFE